MADAVLGSISVLESSEKVRSETQSPSSISHTYKKRERELWDCWDRGEQQEEELKQIEQEGKRGRKERRGGQEEVRREVRREQRRRRRRGEVKG